MADKIVTGKVTLYEGGKVVGSWIVRDNRIARLNDSTIAFVDLDTKKMIQVTGTYVYESDSVMDYFGQVPR